MKGLPDDIGKLYAEARRATSVSAFSGSVLLSRKVLMHVAVFLGAKPNDSFRAYVDYLAANSHVPPTSKAWVDHIRERGNEANHQIVVMSQSDAEELLTFLEMLLKLVYEFPQKLSKKGQTP